MAFPVLILGRSGSGKSRSLKNFKSEELGVIKVIEKEFPFKSDLKSATTSDYATIKEILRRAATPSIVVDDAGYLLTDEFMRRATEKGYDKFTELANNFYDFIKFVQTQLPREKIVYLMMHEVENEVTGEVKPKTLGKLLDEKVCIEGLFTVVLRCVDHKFLTNNSGCAKTPEDMFDSDEIENDLKVVDDVIRNYYNLGGK